MFTRSISFDNKAGSISTIAQIQSLNFRIFMKGGDAIGSINGLCVKG